MTKSCVKTMSDAIEPPYHRREAALEDEHVVPEGIGNAK
jgi:hypothetical protein